MAIIIIINKIEVRAHGTTATAGDDSRGVAAGHRPRDDGDRGTDWFRVATVSLIAYRVSTLGFCSRGMDWCRLATASLIVFRVSTLWFCARGLDWFKIATVSLIAFRIST